MYGRFSRGLQAVDVSLDVFRRQPSLALLPLASLTIVGSAYAAIALVLLQHDLLGALFTNSLLQYAVAFVALASSSVLGIFFNAAVVHCASQHLRGETPTVRDGLAAAWAVRGTILKWGIVNATLGTILYIVEDNIPGVGGLVHAVLDIAWAILTFFIVPVIVVERTPDLRSGLRESGETFRETWGESVTATVGIGAAFLPVILVGGGLLVYAYLFASGPAVYLFGAAGAVLLAASMVLTQVLGMVVRTALYHHAKTGEEVDLIRRLGEHDVFVDG
jgi:hypothetical protein